MRFLFLTKQTLTEPENCSDKFGLVWLEIKIFANRFEPIETDFSRKRELNGEAPWRAEIIRKFENKILQKLFPVGDEYR